MPKRKLKSCIITFVSPPRGFLFEIDLVKDPIRTNEDVDKLFNSIAAVPPVSVAQPQDPPGQIQLDSNQDQSEGLTTFPDFVPQFNYDGPNQFDCDDSIQIDYDFL